MASDDSSGSRSAAPIVLRIKLRYDDVEVMVQRFATNVGKSGLFLPTKSLQPIGAEIKFELRLSDDTAVLVGLGRVKAATPPDPNNPRATFGMAIELMRVTPQSRALILRMLERRRELGLPELGLPTPADIDAARRAEAVSAAVREPVRGHLSAATASSEAPPPAPTAEPLSTSPRGTTGPMAVAKVLAATPLPPEPQRRKRMMVSEVIESASGPIASVSLAAPGLDEEVDVAAAITRARALASGGLDAELDALSAVAAAPLEISIEAASAELARQFGGSAVRRDRSARWAPPPVAMPPATSTPSPSVVEQAPEPAPEARTDTPPEHASSIDPDGGEPEQITGTIPRLGELDLADTEHTDMAAVPSDPGAFDGHGDGSEPPDVDHALPGARLPAQLAGEEAGAAADDPRLAGAPGMPAYSDRARYDEANLPEEVDEFEILSEHDIEDVAVEAAPRLPDPHLESAGPKLAALETGTFTLASAPTDSLRDVSRSRPTPTHRPVPQAPSPPQGRAFVPAPSRAARQTGPIASRSSRVAVPRAPTDGGVVIDLDDDDDR
jgi:hypothetical protein